MTMSDGQLTSNIVGTLQSKAMEKVNFKVGKFTIGTMHYITVAAFMTGGQIKCKVDPTKVGEASAIWDAKGFIYAANKDQAYPDEKVTLVHESTHAAIQMLVAQGAWGVKIVKVLDNEVAAYLAGALYVVSTGFSPSYGNANSPQAKALQVARSKPLGSGSTNAGSPLVFTDAEVAPIAAAVKAMPLYKDWNTDVALTRFW